MTQAGMMGVEDWDVPGFRRCSDPAYGEVVEDQNAGRVDYLCRLFPGET